MRVVMMVTVPVRAVVVVMMMLLLLLLLVLVMTVVMAEVVVLLKTEIATVGERRLRSPAIGEPLRGPATAQGPRFAEYVGETVHGRRDVCRGHHHVVSFDDRGRPSPDRMVTGRVVVIVVVDSGNASYVDGRASRRVFVPADRGGPRPNGPMAPVRRRPRYAYRSAVVTRTVVPRRRLHGYTPPSAVAATLPCRRDRATRNGLRTLCGRQQQHLATTVDPVRCRPVVILHCNNASVRQTNKTKTNERRGLNPVWS